MQQVVQLKLVYEVERQIHLRELIQVPVLFLSSDRAELAGQLWDMSVPVVIQTLSGRCWQQETGQSGKHHCFPA